MHSFLQSLTEKQAKELREMKGGRSILENLNDRFVIVNLSFGMQKQTRKHL